MFYIIDNLAEEEEWEYSKVDIVTIVAGVVGGVALLIVILTVLFIYIQSTKAKRARRRLARGGDNRSRNSSSRIHPFDSDYRRQFMGPPPPPAYGDIFRAPMSPPPEYSVIDPNPQQDTLLPGTPDNLQATANTNSASPNVTTISHTPDVNSNTHFLTTALPQNIAAQSMGRVNRRYEFFSPRNSIPQSNSNQSNAFGGSSNRVVSNGALAAMQILNPSVHGGRSPRTNQGNTEENGVPNTEGSSCLTNRSERSPSNVTSLNSTRIAQNELTGDEPGSNVVEVEVHRTGSVVSDLSEMTLSTVRASPNGSTRSNDCR